MKKISRRDFIKVTAAGMGALAISTGLMGCSSDDDGNAPYQVTFSHGVASGDPLSDRVIIWTRALPDDAGAEVSVSWEVADDAGFTNLLHTGTTQTSAAQDFTVKVDVLNLQPGATYYYRFTANGATSPAGVTKTLPTVSPEQVKFAVFSCANYPAGHFNVYAEAALHDDLDAVIHLGDYIYEYGAGGYATEDAAAIGRTLPDDNANEILTLADYRKRYALYRSDANLQALHHKTPFITVWDDHEVADDTWKSGAKNHNEGEGEFEDRKIAALQAYFEWMPIRPVVDDNQEIIYRQFQFGDLVSLYMLDTRVLARDKQLDYLDYLDPVSGNFNAPQFSADVSDANRTLLGAEQRNWLQNAMAASNATWQVLGQQILMGRMLLPAELLTQLLDPDPNTILPAFAELANIKGRILMGDPSVTDAERARVETVLPYNLDAWDGYAAEREVLFETAKAMNKNLVALAGDTHNAWASDLKTLSGDHVGVEFATASVSSPGLETYLSLPDDATTIAQTELGVTTLVSDLQYLNVNQRGYLLTTFTADEARADWRFVDTVKSPTYQLAAARSVSYKTLPGQNDRKLIAV
ncbi:alkaline phosphatase [Hahella sp. HN01]|uniref:alkaline phosphatase D family protein n=1 Tax=Hahella sp. HN01 TaxID=2847262 RepID=UPI001C1F126B|nr:alkaline phosphatase D family protein [Hahella sp. HN01]MBU6953052.1 alkaline phosphatase D family protein [Hahella sp. HN01]